MNQDAAAKQDVSNQCRQFSLCNVHGYGSHDSSNNCDSYGNALELLQATTKERHRLPNTEVQGNSCPPRARPPVRSSVSVSR